MLGHAVDTMYDVHVNERSLVGKQPQQKDTSADCI